LISLIEFFLSSFLLSLFVIKALVRVGIMAILKERDVACDRRL